MQNGDIVAEYGAKAIDSLRCERDLWHEHDRGLAALVDDLLQQLEIDERLAAARDAVKQRDVTGRRGGEHVDRTLLRRRWFVRGRRRPSAAGEWIARKDFRLDGRIPAVDQTSDGGVRDVKLVADLLDCGASAHRLSELIQRSLLLRAGEDPI